MSAMVSLDKMRGADLMPPKGTKDYLMYLEHQMAELEKARREREQRKKLLFESELLELRLQAMEQECFYPETVLGDKRVTINTINPDTGYVKPKEETRLPVQETRPPVINVLPAHKEHHPISKQKQAQENQDQLFEVIQSMWASPRDIEDILNRPGVNVNAKTEEGLCPIHLAVIRKTAVDKDEVIRLLDRYGANLNATTSKDTNTALHLAARTNDKVAATTLVELGANREAKNKNEETPLDYAIRLDHSDIADILEGRRPYDAMNAKTTKPSKGSKDKPKNTTNNNNNNPPRNNNPNNNNSSKQQQQDQKKNKSCTIL